MATFGYDDLFADQRVIVFSITNVRTVCSGKQLHGFIENYKQFKQIGIDDVYAVDSTDWMIGPAMNTRSQELKGLPDRDMEFVRALAEHYEYSKQTIDLARYWQYVVVIDNGEPERLWHNPFKEDAPLQILKDPVYRYRKLSPDIILEQLVDKVN